MKTVTLLVALLAVRASAADFSVGPPELIYTASQRVSLGLNFWPDGSFGMSGGHFYAANGPNPVRTTGTLTSLGLGKQSVSIVGGSGFNYRAGGPIYVASGKTLLLYHAEQHINGNPQHFYTTLGLASSTDGLSFTDLGTVLRCNIQSPQFGSVDMGSGSFSVKDGYLYIHYRDYQADGSAAQLAVARAPLADVLNGSTTFSKYYNGDWAESGIGGQASPLEDGNPNNNWSSVTYNDYLGQFVMTVVDGSTLSLSVSDDGITWEPRQTVSVSSNEQFYPTIVGTGKSLYVYYTDSAAGAWNRWTDAALMRRRIVFDASLPDADPPGWTTVAGFLNDFQGGAPATGWKYQWSSADLQWSTIAGVYNTTGGVTPVWNGTSHPDDYLTLGPYGGHPGQPNYNVIAGFTVDAPGIYRIVNSSIAKIDTFTHSGEDGLSVRVFVNGTQVGGTQTVTTDGATLNFDRALGELNAGDTVYVVVGAAANQNYDGFRAFDFTIQRAPLPVWEPVANFQDDFGQAGWNYYWNPNGSLPFTPLQWSNIAGAYNTTGVATQVWSGGAGHNDDYLQLGNGSGHPGRPNYHVIVAYTIATAGEHRISASNIAKLDGVASGNEDPVVVSVYVNNVAQGGAVSVPVNGSAASFNRVLGQLAAGDTIYVVIGPGANQNYDSFKDLNFTVDRLAN